MHVIQQSQTKCMALNVSTAATATNGGQLDTLGFSGMARISVFASSLTNSNVPDVLRITESDTTDGTFTAIAGCTGGTDFTMPTQGTNSTLAMNPLVVFDIDLSPKANRKRYLQAEVTPHTTCNVTVMALLTGKDNWNGSLNDACGTTNTSASVHVVA